MLKFRNILACIDGSSFDDRVVEAAISMAQALHSAEGPAKLRLVTIVDTPHLVVDEGLPTPMEQVAILEQEAEGLVEGMKAKLPPDVEGSVEVRRGAPAHEIAQIATSWPADLVVIGTHGRTGIDRILVGSVAEAVLRHVTCPVLVVRAG